MKKKLILSLTIIAVLLTTLQGCKESENLDTVSVEKNLFSVEVTLPLTFVLGADDYSLEDTAEEMGAKKVTRNDNGSVTFKMKKSAYKKMLKSYKENIDFVIEEILRNKSDYPSIMEITYNKDVTEFVIKVDASLYDEYTINAAVEFFQNGMMYQMYNGVPEKKTNVRVKFVDQKTKDVLDKYDSKDFME